jgi:hypothetical protein
MQKVLDLANAPEAVQDGRIFIELLNGPFLFQLKGTTDQYKAGFKLAIERGFLQLDERGTFVKFTTAGTDL